MNKKNITIIITSILIFAIAVGFIFIKLGEKKFNFWRKNNLVQEKTLSNLEDFIPKDNPSIDNMTKEQVDFANEFANKVKLKE